MTEATVSLELSSKKWSSLCPLDECQTAQLRTGFASKQLGCLDYGSWCLWHERLQQISLSSKKKKKKTPGGTESARSMVRDGAKITSLYFQKILTAASETLTNNRENGDLLRWWMNTKRSPLPHSSFKPEPVQHHAIDFLWSSSWYYIIY